MSVTDFNGDAIYTNRFDQIQPLGDAFTSPSAPAGHADSRLSLENGAIDLLTARIVGDKLSKEALSFMVTRQWERENRSGAVPVDRFFAVGKREPTPKEAAELGPQYIAWAAKEQPSLPAHVTLHRQVEIRKGQNGIAWTSLDCFGGFEGLSNSMNVMMGINSELGSCARRRANGQESPQQQSQCVALQAAAASLSATQSLAGTCKMPLSLGFADPASIAFHFDQDLPVLQPSMLGDSMKADVTLSLEISGATWSQSAPSPRDLLPQDVLAALSQIMTLPAPETKQGIEFVTFEAKLVGLDVRDEDGRPVQHEALASQPPLSKLIDEFHESQQAASSAPAIDSGSYGPDMVGLRLGMDFTEAEAIVRNEMKVGRVLQGKRASTTASPGQLATPMSSGKLFISEDGLELIALLDEPPSAANRVVAMWRRVYVPANTVLPQEIFAKVQEKYGPPTGRAAQSLQPGTIAGWFKPSGQNCSGLFGAVKAKPLAEDWTDAGAPAVVKSPNSTYPKGPFLSATLYDPMNTNNKIYQGCGPLVTVSLLDVVSIGGPMMELDTTLTDLERYEAIYDENLKQLRAQSPQGGATAATKF